MIFALLLACFGTSTGDNPPAAGTAPAAALPPSERPDVVLITLDTTRADRVGAWGYADAKTPTIDGLANAGTRFANAYSPIPLTIPAHSTMFTGLFPYHTNIRSNGDNVLAKDFTTLAERMKDAGWNTGASVSAFVTTRQWGLSQGFDAYFDQLPEDDKPGPDRNFWHQERPGNEVVDDALGWLSGQPSDKPVFLWCHFYDVHFPYIQHAEQGDTYKDRPYDGEVAFVDSQIARLTKAFEGRNVVWVLVGDHGESLGEHDESQHGLYAYNSTAHVPFALSGWHVPQAVVDAPVSTADVTPTVLRAVGLPVPDGLDGKAQPGDAQVPYVESYQLSDRYRLAPHVAVVSDGYKLINTPKPELYDQKADPLEKTNLAAQKPEEVAKLQALLTAKNATPPGASGATMDAQTLSQLAAMGYVSGDGMAGVDLATLPDPKDFQEFLAKANRLEVLTKRKGADEGLKELNELIAMRPESFELRMRKVNMLGQAKRMDELSAYMAQIAKDFPDKARVWVTLASMAMSHGNAAEALVDAERAVTIEPKGVAGQEAVIEALLTLKRRDEAVQRGTTWMQENPENFGVAALLGQYYLNQKDFQKAEEFLRIAVAGPNPRRGSRTQLAILAAAAGARPEGQALLEAEVKDYPGNVLARRLLAKLYGEDQRWLDEKVQLEFLRKVTPKDVSAVVAMAQCQFNLKDYAGARVTINEALAMAPEDPETLLLHANLLAKEGKKEEGYAVFQKADALNKAKAKAAEAARGTNGAAGPKSAKGAKSSPPSAPAGGKAGGK